MSSIPSDERGRDGAEADRIDDVGEPTPDSPLEGLLDPENGVNTPASDTDAPPP
jgi:hypothetical protein